MGNTINDYDITERLHESGSTLICRGRRIGTAESLILKILKPDAATRDERARFRREFEITSNLNAPGVVKVLGLEEYPDGLIMVMEDIGGRSLDSIPADDPLPLMTSLEIAVMLAETLGSIHRQQVIHKNINPSHIVWNRDTKRLNLIDFGIADEVPERTVSPQAPSTLEGTLAYISPEQTGRMNRPVDYRTDFYSFGVTLYQMLTGRLPFEADDALGIVHCHIAGIPTAPHRLLPEIPEMISLIVMKLMAKMADKRYHSAWGLKADLEKCRRRLSPAEGVQRFELGAEDFSEQLRFTRKLYGREKETERLLKAFDRVTAGTPILFLVTGYAGTGKTALVRELYPSVAGKQGHFIEGKFEQLQRNVPYFGWIQALEGLVNCLLMEGEVKLIEWKQAIQNAVGNIGRVLTDVIPNLELIIGPQPVIPELGDIETQNRFNHVFLQFVKAIATKDCPLVVFLDDLQWIEAASLKLLETLLTGSGVSNIMLIGAYRDNEVDELHPLVAGIDRLRKENVSIELQTVRDLSEQSVNELIADSLHHAYAETVPLSHLIYSKTGGNPFFLLQTLKALNDKKAITFNTERRTWQWNTQTIDKMGMTDNVVTLMTGKIRQLAPKVQQLLPLAACIGFKFSLSNLSLVAKQSEGDALEGLEPAMCEGLIIADAGQYRFVHDRVHEAAYTLIPVEERPAQHLTIGRLLLEETPEDRLTENIFDIVNHLNRGMPLITETEEQKQLAELNLMAGRRARTAPAFTLAATCFEAGIAALGPRPLETNYNPGFSLHTELAECEYMIGNFDHSLELLSEALGHARSLLDQAWVYRLYQRAYQYSGHWPESVNATFKGLALFGVSFPEDEEEIRRITETENRKIKKNLRGRRIADLVDAPLIEDAEVQALLAMLSEALSLVYITHPVLWPLIMARTVNLCLEKGHVEESPNIYSGYSMMLAGLSNDIDTAFQFSQMSLKLNARIPGGGAIKGRIQFFHSSVVSIWREHFGMSLPSLTRAFQDCIDSGDLLWASYLTYHAIWLHWETGDPLEQVTEIARRYERFNQENKYDAIYSVNRIQEQFVLCLQGKTRSLTDFGDETFDEVASAATNIEAGFDVGVAYYYIMKQIAAFHAGCFDEALKWADRAKTVLPSVSSMAIWAAYYFYHALTLARLYGKADRERQQEFMGILVEIQEKQKFRASNCPENFTNRALLVDAEIARIEKRDLDAMRFYEEAIASARENRFIQYEAVAYEVAAEFYRQRGYDKIARTYLAEAVACYSRWGASGKVRQLERLHPWLTSSMQPASVSLAERLDTVSLAKAQHAISSEIQVDRLAQTLLRIVMENAGATKCGLSVEDGSTLLAVMTPGENKVPQIVFESVRVGADIPDGILNYVRHTREPVILGDAHVDTGAFSMDDYLQRVKPKSVLCMPVQRKDRLLAVLYLENNLASGIFTPERRTMIEMLAAQAAVSLEISGLYEALRQNQALLSQAEEVAQSGSFDWDLRTNTAMWSPGMHRLFEIPVEEFNGDPAVALGVVHPDDAGTLARAMQDVIEEKKMATHIEYRIVPPSGRVRHILAQGTLVLDEHGDPIRMIGVSYDITDRKQAEAEIERLKNHLANIIDSMPTMLVGMDANEMVTRWNRQAEAATGIPATEAVGRPVHQMIPDLSPYIEAMADEIRQRRPAVMEKVSIEKEGERRLYDLVLFPLISNGAEGAVLRVEDVTERSRIQEMMVQTEKMMSLGGLAAGMAHEINNPLGIISQAAQNIERRISHDIPANQSAAQGIGITLNGMKAYFEERGIYDFIGSIRDASIRASRIIQNILRFSRGTENILKPISPASVLDQALELATSDYDLKKKYDFKSIEIVRDEAPDIPDVPMVAVEMEQVMLNLLRNAAQAMAANPPERKPRMTIRLCREDRYVRIEVEDNGPGMAEEVRRRVFEPFFSTKEPSIGTGLGLSVSYMIVTQNHKGLMEVTSTPGQGTCFKIWLPLATENM